MIDLIHFATLVLTTMFAAAVAVSLTWVLLRGAFAMMQPAAARKSTVRTGLVRGTAQLAEAFAGRR
jgi:hypothetical protein